MLSCSQPLDIECKVPVIVGDLSSTTAGKFLCSIRKGDSIWEKGKRPQPCCMGGRGTAVRRGVRSLVSVSVCVSVCMSVSASEMIGGGKGGVEV